ncbi:Glutamate receptor 2.8, partial [Bienertia sinuspersici]
MDTAMAQQQDGNETTPTIKQRLKIAVPVKPGFVEFATMKPDAVTGEPTFGDNGNLNSTYDDMLKAVSSGEFDAAVGDISITYYRTQWVEFTLPHSETGVSMLVRLQPSTPRKTKKSFLIYLPQALIGSALAACILNALLFCLLRIRNNRRQRANNK